MNNIQLTFKIFDSIDEIELQWDSFGNTLPNYQFYQKPVWFKSYGNSLSGKQYTPYFIFAYDNKKIVAIVPVEYTTLKKAFFKLKVLRFPFHAHIDMCDFLMNQSIDKVFFNQLITFIDSSNFFSYDVIFLDKCSELSSAHQQLKNTTAKNIRAMVCGSSSYIKCLNTYEDTVEHISSKFKKNVLRLERKAAKEGKLEYISYECSLSESNELLNKYFQLFLDVESDSWKSVTQTAIKCNQSTIEFYKYLIYHFKEPDSCIINLLKLDNEVIAVQLGVRVNKQINLLKIGFRQKYKHLGPGNLILKYTLEHAVKKQIKIVSMTTSPLWAEKWKSDSIKMYRYFIFNGSLMGNIAKISLLFLPIYKKIKLVLKNNK